MVFSEETPPPPQSINPLELAMDSLSAIQKRFYADFPPHPEEARYGFATSSTLKPTQWACKWPLWGTKP